MEALINPITNICESVLKEKNAEDAKSFGALGYTVLFVSK